MGRLRSRSASGQTGPTQSGLMSWSATGDDGMSSSAAVVCEPEPAAPKLKVFSVSATATPAAPAPEEDTLPLVTAGRTAGVRSPGAGWARGADRGAPTPDRAPSAPSTVSPSLTPPADRAENCVLDAAVALDV